MLTIKNSLVVGLGEIQVSNLPGIKIKALALGSCIAIIAIAPKQRTVGLAHVVLPESKIDLSKASSIPGYFADTAMPALLDAFRPFGVHTSRELVIKLAGGASVMDDNRTFDIGKRNLLACRKALWQQQLAPLAEAVGGNYSRTVWVEVDTGRVYVESPGKGRWEI